MLTIGLAPSVHGILVAQVQLRQKRGNRFLYKLPVPYLDFALDLVHRAFPSEALYLVTGNSTTAAIRAAYRKTSGFLAAETAESIARFYGQPLRDYARTGVTVRGVSDDGRVFEQLERSINQQRAAA